MKAEKALLTILKFDEKNAAAYNRLGILYAKEKHYKEAIECFEIAQSLEKLGERNKAVESLETAYSLNPNTVVLRHLLELYENAEDYENIEVTKRRIEDLQLKKAEMEAKADARERRNILGRTVKKQKEAKAKRVEAKKQAAATKAQAKPAHPQTNPTTHPASAHPAKKLARKRKII